MNKKYVMGLFAFLMIATVSAIIVTSNGHILTTSEMSALSNQDIANYMDNSFERLNVTRAGDNLFVLYNIVYVEPIRFYNNVTNLTEDGYREFSQAKKFTISISLVKQCLNKASMANCVDILVTDEEPYVYEMTVDNVARNVTIKSTYLQAYEEQGRQYQRAKEFRDDAAAADDELDELLNMIE